MISLRNLSYLVHLCILCALVILTAAGCATTAPPESPATVTTKPAPRNGEEPAASTEKGAVISSAREGADLLAGILNDLQKGADVDPADTARVIQIMPENPVSWFAAGLAASRAGDMTTAMERLTRSATLDPVNALTLMTLGETAFTMGDLTKADRYFSIAYEASPTPESANRLALLRIDGGYLESAREALSRTLENYPDDQVTRNNLAVALDMMGDTLEGLALLENESISDPALLHTRALLQLKEGQPGKAGADLDNGFGDGEKTETWLLLGATALQQGEVESAAEKFRKAIQIAEGRYEGYLNLGLTLRRQGLFADAEKTYLDGIASAPHPDLHLNLGILYELYRGDSMKALEHYRKYLEAGGGATSRVEGWVKYLEGVLEIN